MSMSYQYIAGMFDGEGTLSIFRHHAPSFRKNIKRGYAREFRLNIANTNLDVILEIKKFLGYGEIITHKHANCFSFSIRFCPTQLRILLPKILPYLIIKKDLTMIMFEALTTVKNFNIPIKRREEILLQLEEKFWAFKKTMKPYLCDDYAT